MDYWFVWVPIFVAGIGLWVPATVLPWRRSKAVVDDEPTEVFELPRELSPEETQEMKDLWTQRRVEHEARVAAAVMAPTVVMVQPSGTVLVPEESLATRRELEVLSLAYYNDRAAESLSTRIREVRVDWEQFWVRDRHEWDALVDHFDRSMRVLTGHRSILEIAG